METEMFSFRQFTANFIPTPNPLMLLNIFHDLILAPFSHLLDEYPDCQMHLKKVITKLI